MINAKRKNVTNFLYKVLFSWLLQTIVLRVSVVCQSVTDNKVTSELSPGTYVYFLSVIDKACTMYFVHVPYIFYKMI